MAAPKGNKFYLLAENIGRPKTFETPADLWSAFLEYQNWASEHPWNKIDFKGKDAVRVKIPCERPLTLHGFAVYLGMTHAGIMNYGNADEYKEFFAVYARIKDSCYAQKFEGATVGVFNPVIIARDLGLVEKSENTLKADIKSNITVQDLETQQLIEDMRKKFESEE